MFDPHYSASFDSLCELEDTINMFPFAREFFAHILEKAKDGENVEGQLTAAIGFLDYLIERGDKQMPNVWNIVITNHPSRMPTDD